MAYLDDPLARLVSSNGSDLHFVAGEPLRMRIYGELQVVDPDPLTPDKTREALLEIMPPAAVEAFNQHDSADFAYLLEGQSRFRVNVLRHLGGMAGIFRAIPSQAKTMSELNMPAAVSNMCKHNQGLILVTGKTGSGKSTTLAAMIDEINRTRNGHILTIEDPIEFVHQRVKCLISQREIGQHSKTFSDALHSGLREDPDVILVGEMRDLETISIAVTAAEMGILVMGTLHTNGAASTVDRIVNSFPADKQPQVRAMLSTSLRGVISQQLLPRPDGKGLCAALEILVSTPAVSNMIRQGKLDQLENAMTGGRQYGMRTMDSVLEEMMNKGEITGRTAYEAAIEKRKFEEFKEVEA